MSDRDHHHHDHSHDTHPHQLQPPHEVFHDAKAGEVARVWISNGALSLALHAGAFGKAEPWGHVLAGMAQQVAAACAELGHGTASGNFAEIRKALNDDMATAAGQMSALGNKS